jgi:hypothetical protein
MSSKRNNWRAFLSFLDDNPRAESILEVLFVTVTTFVPLAVATLMSMSRDKEFVWNKFKSGFTSYFTAGELILIVLSVCGSVIWIYVIKSKSSGMIERFIFTVLIICIVLLLGGGILGNNPGFSDEYPGWVLLIIFFSYVLSLFLWLYASISAKSDGGAALQDEGAKADDLLRRAKEGIS